MMETRCTKYERLKIFAVVVIISCLSVFNVQVTKIFADSAATVEKTGQEEVTNGSDVVLEADPGTKNMPENEAKKATGDTVKPPNTSPKTTKTSDTSPLVYLGAGAAVAAAIGLAAASGGGSDSDSSTPEGVVGGSVGRSVKPEQEPKNATLWGDNWSGRLLLINGKREQVTAVVYQNGAQVEIVTSSTQRYGRRFVGSVSSSGHMRMTDTTTRELWTTFKGPANPTRIDLYDYVNNFQDLDNLLLTRSSKQY